VILAPGSGDDAVAAIVSEASGDGQRVTVVTADRGLIGRVERLGAGVERPSQFLNRLEPGAH
jgi:hypothetical protein